MENSVYHTTLFRVLFLGPVWGPRKASFSPDPPHHSYKYTCRAICGAMYQVHPLSKSPKLPIPRAIWWCDNYLAYFFGGCPWHLSDDKKPKQKANQFHLLAAYYKIYLFVCWAFFMVLRFNRKNKGENRNKQEWEPRWGNIIICFVVLANIFASHLCLPFIFFCTLNVLAFSTFLSLSLCVCVVDWWKWKFCSFSMPLHEPKWFSLFRSSALSPEDYIMRRKRKWKPSGSEKKFEFKVPRRPHAQEKFHGDKERISLFLSLKVGRIGVKWWRCVNLPPFHTLFCPGRG